jgi:hypothetical protein
MVAKSSVPCVTRMQFKDALILILIDSNSQPLYLQVSVFPIKRQIFQFRDFLIPIQSLELARIAKFHPFSSLLYHDGTLIVLRGKQLSSQCQYVKMS